MSEPAPAHLAQHYRQLRTTRGTVLLGPADYTQPPPRLDPAWFVDECPLEPAAALAVLATRHGYADAEATRAAVRKALAAEAGSADSRSTLLRELA